MGKKFMKRILAILCAVTMAASNAACVLPVNAEEVSAAQDEDETSVQTAASQNDGNAAEAVKSDDASADEGTESADNASLKEYASSDDTGSQETASADQAASQDKNSDENAAAGSTASDQASASSGTSASDTSVSAGSEQTSSSSAVNVTATYVDEFGDAIGTQYTNLSLPDFSDTLSFEKGSTPIKDFQVTDGKFKVTDYSFEKASINGTTITAIKKEAASATDSTAVYSYTSDGTAWTKLTADTNISVTFNDGTKTVYTYEDNDVTVTATLQHANAIPDNAELKVTPVTKTTAGYNYDAYMQAVNSNAEAVASVKGSSDSTGSDGTQNAFNENNSRLYDIAFISNKTDENGNAIAGEKQEYEPTEGSVKISMSFKNKQLTNDIKADKDVSIIHLSLSDDAKKNTDTTAEAKDITSSDVKVQVVSSSTPITTGSSDQVSYDLSSFSLVLYAGSGTADSPVGGTDTYLSILGQARFYGIVANEWTQNEAETNAAVKVINANAQTGTDMTNVATQPWIVGKINGELHFKQGSNAVDLWCTYDDTSKILNQTGKDIAYHYASETDLDAAVDTLLSTPKAASTAMANVSGKVQLDNSKYVTITKDESGNESDYKIDLTSLPKGTYYVDSTEMNLTTNGNLHIFINNDQYIVFTNRSDTVTLQQYDVTIGGTKINAGSVGASGTGYGDTPKVAEHVYWNMPNATTVSFGTSSSGLFLAWKATVTIENSCNGWIVADKVINKGGEWHSVYQEMDKSYTQPASTVFAAKKTVNTAAPDASQIFDFNLDKWDSTSSKWVNVTTARNSGTDVIFPNVSFTEAGTFIYRISENLPADSIYELANGAHAAYYVKVVVVKTTIGTTDYYNITSTKYYQNFNNGDVNGELQDNKPSNAVINNTYKSKIKLCVTKAFSGRELTNDDSFTFTLAAGTNNPTTLTSPMPAQGGNTVTVKKDNLIGIFGEINFTEAGTYNYTIQETIPKGADENGKYNNIQYDKTIHTATIVVEKNTTTNSLEIKSLKYDTNQTSLTVTNTYDVTGKAELSILKALSTGAKPAAGIYSFELKDSEGKVLQTKSNDAEGKVTFDAITYTLRDLGGEASKEFTYTIHESSAAASGWTNATDKTVTVTVTDDGSGTLKVQYDGQDTFTAPTMTNTYGATGKAELSILKALSTGAKPAAGIYSFELKDSEGKVLQTKSNDAEGKVTFDAITYTLSDLGGEASKEFTYTIHESSAAASGWTNAADKTVNVTVSDNGDGTLKVQYDGQDTFTVPTMTNTYGATGKAELSILKALSTGAKPAAGIYSFELKDSEGKVLQTKSNDAYGKVTFDAITYTLSDLGGEASKKFTYRIHESSAAASGWTNAPDKTVTVTVTDDGSGTLKVQYDGQDTFTAPTMTNTYGATGKAELSILKALSTGAKPAAGKYTFELEDSEGKALQTKSNDADGKVTFDAITYTLRDLGGEASKEFTYTIHESSAAASGWTNAPDKTVTVTVTDDGSGTLKVQYDGQDTFTAPTMTNTYGATGKAELSILKALSTGAKPAAGIYTFELEDSEGKALQTKSNDADGKVTFDAITYTLSDLGGEASKEFTYRIHESSAAASGWTNAPDKTVTVTVTDDGSGTLKVQYDGQDTFTAPTMTNTYGATGKAELSILKALSTGAKPAAGKYTFELEDSEGKALQTKSNDADGKVTFDAITYTLSDLGGEASKEFTYRIHESSAAASGWTNAPDKTVTVTVTDDGSGTLKVQYDGQDTFTAPTMTNTYGATGKAELSILKALSTGAKPAAGKYTFELEDSEGKALQTKSNDADGKVTFDAITYTLSDLGGEASKEFTYTIHESSAAASGWTNAPDKTVTVTVTDDGSGTLKVQYDGQDTFTAPTMTNTYGATGKAELSILKALSTGAKPAAGKYTFELEDSEGKALQTKSNDADGKVTFDAITYTLSDLGGEASKEFTYTIHESSAAASGWTNAPDKTVTVTVTDDGSGTLKVQYDGQDTFTVPTMTNTYAAAGSAQLKVDKNFTGRDWAEGDKFTFTLTGEKDAPMPTGDDGNTLTIAYSSTRKDHSGLFGEISYTKAGVYTYDITEKASGLGGVTDDATTHKAVVTVEDKDYNGKFTITVKYDNTDSDAAVFTDTYAASGSTQLKVDKNFTGRDWAVGDKFTFTLTGEKDAPMPTDTAGNTLTIAYSSTSKDYSGLFGEINYTAAGTYTYDITENASGIAGVTDDTTTHKAVVTVEDKDHNGKFTITVKYDNTDSDAAVFTDTYAAYGSTQLKVDKNFTGRDWAEGDKFTFALTGEKDAPMPKEDSGKELTIAYSSTSKDHSGLFGEISYTKAGVYTYDITEKASGLGGVTDDATTHKAVVTVEDKDYNGKFTITVKYDNTDSDAAAFTDTYAASGSTQLKVDKNFTGRDWAVGDKFTFTLKAEENAPMPAGTDGSTLTITYDSKDHTGLFGEISYTKAGTYTYDITENASGLGGVTDDKMTHHAVVTVEDKDHNGKFTITVKYDNTDKDAAVFTDTYGAVGSITFSGTKTLKDGTLSGNEFSFTVKEGDSIVATGTNDKNGKITFTSIHYTLSDVGEHTYTVTETVGTKDGVQYDTTCYTVTVKVTDNHDGTLKIEPSSDYMKLNFTNTISSTTTSTTSTTSSSSVKTGDDSPIALYFILLLFSGAAAALFVTDMKKKKNSGNQ